MWCLYFLDTYIVCTQWTVLSLQVPVCPRTAPAHAFSRLELLRLLQLLQEPPERFVQLGKLRAMYFLNDGVVLSRWMHASFV